MISLRSETAADVEAVADVIRQAFGSEAEVELVAELRRSGEATLSLVANDDGGRVVGHVLFSPMRDAEGGTLAGVSGLAPVSVIPSRQNEGIGSELIREGMERLKKRGIELVAVLGHVGYYPRFGFVRADEEGIGNEFGVGPEFMVAELSEGATARHRGLLRYAEAFSKFA